MNPDYPTKAPPMFVTMQWAWDYTLAKLDEKGKLDEGGNPENYAAACAIYKAVCKKYSGEKQLPEHEQLIFRYEIFQPGVRVRVDDWNEPDFYLPPEGTEGIVVDRPLPGDLELKGMVWVQWDNGSLCMFSPDDDVQIISWEI